MLTTQIRDKVKEFQVLLINTNNSIKHYLFISTQLNCSKYCYVSQIIEVYSLNIKQFYSTHM